METLEKIRERVKRISLEKHQSKVGDMLSLLTAVVKINSATQEPELNCILYK